MIRNYLLVSLRSLKRGLGYTLVNVSGFAIGFTCVILIGLYIQDELSFDAYHSKADRTYRLVKETHHPDGTIQFSPGPIYLGRMIREDLSGFDAVVRRSSSWRSEFKQDDRVIMGRTCIADSSFFDVFDFEFIAGQADRALTTPAGMVMTSRMARKLYGTDQVLGRTVTIQDRYFGGTWTITGVVSDPPTHSMIQFDTVTSQPQTEYGWVLLRNTRWDGPTVTHVVLEQGLSPEEAVRRIRDGARRRKPGLAEGATYHLQPLTDVYLGTMDRFPSYRSGTNQDLDLRRNPRMVVALGAAAILILIVA